MKFTIENLGYTGFALCWLGLGISIGLLSYRTLAGPGKPAKDKVPVMVGKENCAHHWRQLCVSECINCRAEFIAPWWISNSLQAQLSVTLPPAARSTFYGPTTNR